MNLFVDRDAYRGMRFTPASHALHLDSAEVIANKWERRHLDGLPLVASSMLVASKGRDSKIPASPIKLKSKKWPARSRAAVRWGFFNTLGSHLRTRSRTLSYARIPWD